MGRPERRARLLLLERAQHVLVEEAVLAARLLAARPTPRTATRRRCAIGGLVSYRGRRVHRSRHGAKPRAPCLDEQRFASAQIARISSGFGRTPNWRQPGSTGVSGGVPSSTAITFSATSLAIASRAVGRGRADVRSEHDVLELEQLRRDLRLVLVDVEPGAAEPPLVAAPRPAQRASTSPPRDGVHEDRARLHARERARVDQVMRLGRERDVQRHEVRALQQLVERRRARRRAAARLRGGASAPCTAASTSKPRSSSATRVPIRPSPTIPTTAPLSSRPSSCPGSQPAQRPARTSRSASPRRRAAASISATASSAVAFVSTSGVFVTTTPRSRQAVDVDVVVADREVGDHAQASRPAASSSSASTGTVGSATSAAAPATLLQQLVAVEPRAALVDARSAPRAARAPPRAGSARPPTRGHARLIHALQVRVRRTRVGYLRP